MMRACRNLALALPAILFAVACGDGARDGVLENPLACRFDPQVLDERAAGEVLATNVLSRMIQRVLVENVAAEKAVEEAHKKVVEIYARYPEG